MKRTVSVTDQLEIKTACLLSVQSTEGTYVLDYKGYVSDLQAVFFKKILKKFKLQFVLLTKRIRKYNILLIKKRIVW